MSYYVYKNEWVKLKRELQEALEHAQLLKPESEGTRCIVLRQGDDNELELANGANPVSFSEVFVVSYVIFLNIHLSFFFLERCTLIQ